VYDCVVRSLRSHARINPSTQPADGLRDQDQDQKLLELALIVLSGEKHAVSGFGFVLDSPLTPALSRGRGSRFVSGSKSAFDSVSQVGVPHPNNPVGPLSLRERARVRGFWIFCKNRARRLSDSQPDPLDITRPLERACSRRRPDSRPVVESYAIQL
jgi:hypothetical protein